MVMHLLYLLVGYLGRTGKLCMLQKAEAGRWRRGEGLEGNDAPIVDTANLNIAHIGA